MSAKLLQQILKNVYGEPAWQVRQRYGPCIFFEFGKPKVDVWEKVLQPKKNVREYPKRMVRVYGDWHFNTFCSTWEIRQKDKKICDSSSKEKVIDHGCEILDGQILKEVSVHPKTLITDFFFDLGGHLQTKPFNDEKDDSSMWKLFCPDGRVFSLNSDGTYSFESKKTPLDKKRYSPFAFDLQ